MYNQPANSPDLNVNDLGFFASIQGLQHRGPSNNVNKMVNKLATVFENYPYQLLNNSFLTLQNCTNSIIEYHSLNDYKLVTHMNKQMLERRPGIHPHPIVIVMRQ